MKKFAIIASLAVSLAVATAAQATELVTNGNFSSLTSGLGQLGYNTDATGWTTSGYNFVMNLADLGSSGQFGGLSLWDATNAGSTAWNGQSPIGGNFVAMDGEYNTGPITQTITGLTAGASYTLTFDYAFSQQYAYTGDTIQSLSGSLGSSTFSTGDFNLPSTSFSGWQTYTTTVTADGTSDVLSFLAAGNLPVPPFALITGVSLTAAVPEPATWAMMIVGLGAMGVVARRRRRMLAAA